MCSNSLRYQNLPFAVPHVSIRLRGQCVEVSTQRVIWTNSWKRALPVTKNSSDSGWLDDWCVGFCLNCWINWSLIGQCVKSGKNCERTIFVFCVLFPTWESVPVQWMDFPWTHAVSDTFRPILGQIAGHDVNQWLWSCLICFNDV